MADGIRLKCSEYKASGMEMLGKVGVEPEHAEITMLNLLDSDEKGIYTHGLYRMTVYMQQLKRGIFNPHPEVKKVKEGKSVTIIDGDDGLGAVVSYYAMKEALNICHEQGVGVVGVRNSTHFGTAAYWAEMASAQDLVGLCFTNASPSIAPTGSTEPLFGNNPWSISVPTNREHPVTMDISNSVVARGKIRVYESANEPIPLGWALNKDGQPTTNASEAMASKLLMPIGDYKGYGITMMVDVIAGVLTGAAFANKVGLIEGEGKRNSGHLFIVLKIKDFMDVSDFKNRMDELWDIVKSGPRADENVEILLPGEREWKCKLNQDDGSVDIPEVSYKAYQVLCDQYGISCPKNQVQR